MGSVGDWEVTAESQVSCRLVSFPVITSPVLLPLCSSSLPMASPQQKGTRLRCWPLPCPRFAGPLLGHAAPCDASLIHGIPVFPLSFLVGFPGCCQGSVTFEVPLLYISQEALGPGKHAEKEFRKNPPGDNCGNGVSLGKEAVPPEDDVGFLVYSVPTE